MGRTPMLPSSLIDRICERLRDDWRRTGIGDLDRTPRDRRNFGGLLGGQQATFGALGSLLGSFGGGMAKRPDPPPLPPLSPASAAALDKTEKKLGFPLPPGVRQLYEIADGGFGPWDG